MKWKSVPIYVMFNINGTETTNSPLHKWLEIEKHVNCKKKGIRTLVTEKNRLMLTNCRDCIKVSKLVFYAQSTSEVISGRWLYLKKMFKRDLLKLNDTLQPQREQVAVSSDVTDLFQDGLDQQGVLDKTPPGTICTAQCTIISTVSIFLNKGWNTHNTHTKSFSGLLRSMWRPLYY